MITMPMVYVTDETEELLEDILEKIKKSSEVFTGRIVKADVINFALRDYAKKIGVKGIEE